jgi:Domain of unknown function (DUF4440)
MKRITVIILASLLMISCKTKDEQQHHSGTQTNASANKKQSAGITRAQADSLLQVWLTSQNTGNFDSYAALYATKFDGIKRSGKKTYRFNRNTWLNDRKRMFVKKMSVNALEPSVTLIGNMALIRFNQTWETKGYKDRGPKELQLALFEGAVKIIREEMLASFRGSVPQDQAVDDFRFIIEDDLLVLDHYPVLTLADGAPYLSDRSNTAYCAVNTDQFDDTYKKLIESPWLVISENGDTLTTKITSVILVARATPHFGTVQQWDENSISDDDKALELWDMAQARDGIVLAGKLDCQCSNALYAVPTSGPVPKIYKVSSDSSYYEMALAAMKDMPLYESVQKDYQEYETKGEWIDESTAEYSVFTHYDDSSTYVALKLTAGAGCGSFYGSILAIFRINGDSIELISNPDGIADNDMNNYCFPKAAVDFDNDGNPEFIDNGKIIKFTGSYWDIDEEIVVPFYDCGC